MADSVNYIDSVGRISVVNGLAHIDLLTMIPPAQDGDAPNVQVTQRLVMGLPQFVRLCAEMAGQLSRMEEKGLITRTAANSPATPTR